MRISFKIAAIAATSLSIFAMTAPTAFADHLGNRGYGKVVKVTKTVVYNGHRHGHRHAGPRARRAHAQWHRRHDHRPYRRHNRRHHVKKVVVYQPAPVKKVIVYKPAPVHNVIVHRPNVYRTNYPVFAGNNGLLGGIIGATLGAVTGNQFGKGSGRTAAVIGGAIVGAVVGNNIGQQMSHRDHAQVNSVLNTTPSGQVVDWQNPDTGARYSVTPTRTYRTANGTYCRDFTTWGWIDGYEEKLHGTACRQPDGSWRRQS